MRELPPTNIPQAQMTFEPRDLVAEISAPFADVYDSPGFGSDSTVLGMAQRGDLFEVMGYTEFGGEMWVYTEYNNRQAYIWQGATKIIDVLEAGVD